MKIYFSGSIRGGRQDAALYRELINELGKYGQVLTEHIGAETLDEQLSDEQIYETDMNWLRESDIIIAEITTASLGVGYEIGEARALGKRIVCLYRPDVTPRPSAMITGAPDIELFPYSGIEEAREILRGIFES